MTTQTIQTATSTSPARHSIVATGVAASTATSAGRRTARMCASVEQTGTSMSERFIVNVATATVMAVAMLWLVTSQGVPASTVKPDLVTVLPASTSSTSSTTSSSTTSTIAATTTTTIALGFEPHCPTEMLDIAVDVGWPVDQLQTLDRIAWRESRCSATASNPADPGSLGSVGILQTNTAAWCDGTQYYPDGYLQSIGLITTCTDLFDLRTNLAAGLVIWERSGWHAWSTYD